MNKDIPVTKAEIDEVFLKKNYLLKIIIRKILK